MTATQSTLAYQISRIRSRAYRQIPVDQLKIITADVTRSSVQKSVCALLTIPEFGYIEVKLDLITDTFEQGDL